MRTENANAPETVNPRKSRFKVPGASEPAPPGEPTTAELASPTEPTAVEAASTDEPGISEPHVENPPPLGEPDSPPNVERIMPDPNRSEPEHIRADAEAEQTTAQALMSGKVAVVPVEWLERMLSPAQIQQVSAHRAARRERADRDATVAHGEPKNAKLKFCPGCSLEKNRATDFYKMSTSKDGFQPRCKTCQLEASRIRKANRSKSRGTSSDSTATPIRRAGLYILNGKARDTVRGRDTIKRVYAYFKRHKNGVTAKQIQSDLKMPASTVHWTLTKLQEKRAVRVTAA